MPDTSRTTDRFTARAVAGCLSRSRPRPGWRLAGGAALVGTSLLAAGCALAPQAPDALRVDPVLRLEQQPASVQALYALARIELGARRYGSAQGRLAEVLERQPDHIDALNALAVIHAEQGRLDEAVGLLRRALALDPGAAHVHSNLGLALLRLGREAEARAALATSLRLEPGNLRTRANLALLSAPAAGDAGTAVPTAAVGPAPTASGIERVEPMPGARIVEVAPGVFDLKTPEPAVASSAPVQPVAVQPVPAQPVPAQPVPTAGVWGRVEVSNGNGVRGLAGRTARALSGPGVQVTRVSDWRHFRERHTVVHFRDGFQVQAQWLAARVGGGVRPVEVPARSLRAGVDVRLVLGRDAWPTMLAQLLGAPVGEAAPAHAAVLVDRSGGTLAKTSGAASVDADGMTAMASAADPIVAAFSGWRLG